LRILLKRTLHPGKKKKISINWGYVCEDQLLLHNIALCCNLKCYLGWEIWRERERTVNCVITVDQFCRDWSRKNEPKDWVYNKDVEEKQVALSWGDLLVNPMGSSSWFECSFLWNESLCLCILLHSLTSLHLMTSTQESQQLFARRNQQKKNSNPLLLQPSSSPRQGSQKGFGNPRKKAGKTMKTGIGFVSLGVCFFCVCVCFWFWICERLIDVGLRVGEECKEQWCWRWRGCGCVRLVSSRGARRRRRRQ
jgi:hypothetical protein